MVAKACGSRFADHIRPETLHGMSIFNRARNPVAYQRDDRFLLCGAYSGLRSGTSVRQKFALEDAKRFYDRFGGWQDAQLYERAALKLLIAHSDFEHASAVFEVGCGTGRLAEALLRRHLADNATYLGIDISTTMIKIARRRLAPWAGRVTLQEADGTVQQRYADGVFDRFVATYVLDLLPETAINQVLSEAHRLLRRDGKVCLVTSTEGVTPFSRVISSIWRRVYAFNPRLVGGCRPLCLTTFLDPDDWKTEYRSVICSFGICSEMVIASPI
jgi:ubiquinone/menaquinone biosynthesis C-methylase UbiE